MRALVLLSVAMLAGLPFASAAPVPTMTIQIDQSSLSVNASNSNQTLVFTGSVAVNKSAYLSATVTLSGTAGEGWPVDVSPTYMTFTTTTPQSFSATVMVPGNLTAGLHTDLTVNGVVVSGIFRSTASDSASIEIVGPPPANQTGNTTNTTKPSTGGSGNTTIPGFVSNPVTAGFLGFSNEQWVIIAVVAVVALAGAAAAMHARRRRKAPLTVEPEE